MACCCLSDGRRRSNKIGKKMRKEHKRIPHLLLLGAGKSGKSTFLKQMRILHSSGFTAVEREKEYRPLIAKNVVDCVRALHSGIRRLGLSYYAVQNDQLAEAMADYNPEGFLHSGLAEQISAYWLDPAVQECFSRQREFGYGLPDSTRYFMESVMRIGGDKYTPSDQDIIQSRSPTVTVQEVPFTLMKWQIAIVDVGGQPSERRKWVHLFADVAAVIYLSAISEYDQVDPDTGENLLKHCLALLATLFAMPFFERSGFIIFMNKMDVFQDKITYAPMRHYFPEYKGALNDSEGAAKFLEERFREVVPAHTSPIKRSRSPSESLSSAVSSLRRTSTGSPSSAAKESVDDVHQLTFFHRTTATNTQNIKTIFQDVQDMVLIQLLETFLNVC